MDYPIGIQSFEIIRKNDYYYVDKTGLMWDLVRLSVPIFLSRPRRFGKSLLLSTIHSFFNGRKDLFDGLEVSKYEKEWKRYPVFHFDFNTVGSRDITDLTENMDRQLATYEEDWGIIAKKSAKPQDRLITLIDKASGGEIQKVVVLVDEYDKPLLNVIDNEPLQNEFRQILKPFYGVLKTMNRNIRFAMLTGVARFGKLSIFSDLNNLRDISINPEFNAICGITENELYSVYSDSIKSLAKARGESAEQTKQALKRAYDGYHFGKPKLCADIYNPYSLNNAFADRSIGDYWFDSGTPTFLAKRMIKRGIEFSELNDTYASASELVSGITDDDSFIGQLFQTGYLTIKGYSDESEDYELCFPNREVERGFDDLTLRAYDSMTSSDFNLNKFKREVMSGEPEKFMTRLQSFTADFPYDQVPNMEVHWQNIMYLVFKLLGFYTRTEYKTSDGRIDAIVKTPKYLYVFEFKMDESAKVALSQINSKEYPLPFQADGRKIFKIGVEFTSKNRRIKDFVIE